MNVPAVDAFMKIFGYTREEPDMATNISAPLRTLSTFDPAATLATDPGFPESTEYVIVHSGGYAEPVPGYWSECDAFNYWAHALPTGDPFDELLLVRRDDLAVLAERRIGWEG